MMATPLEQAKLARNAAHKAYRQSLAQVQEDLSARSIGGRIADRAGETLAEATDVANENKGVIAGTIAALALWFLRGPIIDGIGRLWDDYVERTDDD
jgi:hypothetical protein